VVPNDRGNRGSARTPRSIARSETERDAERSDAEIGGVRSEERPGPT
jgi:hypothetical protein